MQMVVCSLADNIAIAIILNQRYRKCTYLVVKKFSDFSSLEKTLNFLNVNVRCVIAQAQIVIGMISIARDHGNHYALSASLEWPVNCAVNCAVLCALMVAFSSRTTLREMNILSRTQQQNH